jgi:hypothetical protein
MGFIFSGRPFPMLWTKKTTLTKAVELAIKQQGGK